MPRFLLHHVHRPAECGAVYASFSGFRSTLRHQPADASCRYGGHAIWWHVEAPSERDALALLPPYVALRTSVIRVAELRIP